MLFPDLDEQGREDKREPENDRDDEVDHRDVGLYDELGRVEDHE